MEPIRIYYRSPRHRGRGILLRGWARHTHHALLNYKAEP